MDETLLRLLLTLNKACKSKGGQLTYRIKTLSAYNAKLNAIQTTYYLQSEQLLPKKSLPNIEFANINQLKDYMVKAIEFWQRR